MSLDPDRRDDAILALSGLQVDGVIVGYSTDFVDFDSGSEKLIVTIWIKAQDDLAIERTKRRVRAVLKPFVADVELTVLPIREGTSAPLPPEGLL